MNGTTTLQITAAAKFSCDFSLQAGAVETLEIRGNFNPAHNFRFTVKSPTGLSSPTWTITLTSWTSKTAELLTGSLNLNASALLTYLGDTKRPLAIELWDDTDGYPIARNYDFPCDPPVQRLDDVPATAVPPHTYTDDEVDAAIAALGAGKPVDTKTTPVAADGFTIWDSAAAWVGKFLSFQNLWDNYLLPAASLVFSPLAHTHVGGIWISATVVSALPVSPEAHVTYYLDTLDATAKATPGYYLHNGSGWRCLAYDAAYDLGDLTGAISHTYIPGLQYFGTVTGAITAWTLGATLPGMIGVGYDNPSNYSVAAPTMTGKTCPTVSGAWDAHNGSIVTAIMEWDGHYFWAQCQEGV